MGTDIHLVAQVFDEDTEVWKTSAIHAPQDRDYSLFYALTGIRGNDKNPGRIVAAPRGLPQGVTVDSRGYMRDEPHAFLGNHSHSWLLLSELREFDWDWWLKSTPFYRWVFDQLSLLGAGDKVRIVFGFDA